MRSRRPLLAAIVAVLAWFPPALAQDAKSPTPGAQPKTDDLTPEELAEREGRKACKIAICAAFHNRTATGGDISCTVLKSWRKEQLSAMLAKAKTSWPWGRVRCVSNIKLKRDALAAAMTQPKYETTLDRHEVTCEVEREKEASAQIKFDFSPKVTFENGKATKAALNWGKIEAPTLVKGAMWTATATDNTFNVLQSTLVEDINDFIENKCMEVKADWAAK
ncbi:MAG TPA: hypothetical protein VG966_11535 [Hyphomicrobiaceae bacterium]|nr:hypothetical protein [Hyphomicrobiaceae bacterium]